MADTIEVKLKSLSSDVRSVRVPLAMSVDDLKRRVAEEMGVAVGEQRLIYRGRVLKTGKTLAESGLQDGHTVHVVPRPARAPQQGASAASASTSTPTPPRATASTSTLPGGARWSVHTFNLPAGAGGGAGGAGLPDLNAIMQRVFANMPSPFGATPPPAATGTPPAGGAAPGARGARPGAGGVHAGVASVQRDLEAIQTAVREANNAHPPPATATELPPVAHNDVERMGRAVHGLAAQLGELAAHMHEYGALLSRESELAGDERQRLVAMNRVPRLMGQVGSALTRAEQQVRSVRLGDAPGAATHNFTTSAPQVTFTVNATTFPFPLRRPTNTTNTNNTAAAGTNNANANANTNTNTNTNTSSSSSSSSNTASNTASNMPPHIAQMRAMVEGMGRSLFGNNTREFNMISRLISSLGQSASIDRSARGPLPGSLGDLLRSHITDIEDAADAPFQPPWFFVLFDHLFIDDFFRSNVLRELEGAMGTVRDELCEQYFPDGATEEGIRELMHDGFIELLRDPMVQGLGGSADEAHAVATKLMLAIRKGMALFLQFATGQSFPSLGGLRESATLRDICGEVAHCVLAALESHPSLQMQTVQQHALQSLFSQQGTTNPMLANIMVANTTTLLRNAATWRDADALVCTTVFGEWTDFLWKDEVEQWTAQMEADEEMMRATPPQRPLSDQYVSGAGKRQRINERGRSRVTTTGGVARLLGHQVRSSMTSVLRSRGCSEEQADQLIEQAFEQMHLNTTSGSGSGSGSSGDGSSVVARLRDEVEHSIAERVQSDPDMDETRYPHAAALARRKRPREDIE